MSARKTIQVDEDVWLQLVHLKYQLRARSISEALRQILQNYKNTETQSYKTVEPQNHKSTEPQNHKSTSPQSRKNIEAADLQRVSSAGGRGRRRSPLDEVEDIAIIRNVRNPEALIRAAEARGLLAHDFSAEGFPGVIAVLTRSFVEFAKAIAETESPQLSAVESTAVELLRGRRKLESADDKVALALYALNREGALIWDGSRWVEPGRARPAPPLSEQLEQRRAE